MLFGFDFGLVLKLIIEYLNDKFLNFQNQVLLLEMELKTEMEN